MAIGKVYIVGAGPGDPELITLKGLKILEKADVVLYDRLVSEELLKYVKKDAVKVYVGKKPGESHKQEEINKMLVEYALKGFTVVRLKNGDPLIFGRGAEECLYATKHGIPCEVVPGISSFQAAAAEAGVPITIRGYSSCFAVVTAVQAETSRRRIDIEEIARHVDLVVVFMGASKSVEVLNKLAKSMGENTPGVIVINATLPNQEVIRGSIRELIDKAEKGLIKSPAIIMVGEAVKINFKMCGDRG